MRDHLDTPGLSRNNTMTRRAALRGAACVGAITLPAGAAMAAMPDTAFQDLVADPGLAAIEAGYKRWRELQAERDRLDALRDELHDRADAAIQPMLAPKPKRAREIVKWISEDGAYLLHSSSIPKRLEKTCEAHYWAMCDWRRRHNALLDGQPDYEAYRDVAAKAEELQEEADELKREVLAIPTTSPRGLLIKLALAAEAKTLDDLDQAVTVDTLYQCPWIGEDFLPGLAADLRAMVGRA